jgi:DNA polymerase III delta prime subunit
MATNRTAVRPIVDINYKKDETMVSKKPRTVSPQSISNSARQEWVCDVCKVARFKYEDFKAACDHEDICRIQKEEQKQEQLRLQARAQKQLQQQQPVTDQKQVKRKNPPPPAQIHSFFAPRPSVKRSKQDTDRKNILSDHGSTQPDEVQENKANTTSTSRSAPEKGLTSGAAYPSSSKVIRVKASSMDVVDLTMSEMKKHTRSEVADLTKPKATSKPTSSRKAASATTTTTTDTAPLRTSRKRVDKTKTQQVADSLVFSTSLSAETAAALADLIDMDVRAAEVTTQKKKNIAPIFERDSQKLMEQQQEVEKQMKLQLEFQAKRRLQHQRDFERHQKRAARQLQAEPVTSSASAGASLSSSATAKPSTSVVSKQPATKPPPSMSLLPLAPRFPSPSYVVPAEQPNCTSDSLCEELSHPWVSLSAIQHSRHKARQRKPMSSICEDETDRLMRLSKSSEATGTFPEPRDLLLETFQNVVAPWIESTPNTATDDSRLWVDKFSICNQDVAGFEVLGQANQQAFRRMKSWVDEWRKVRHRAMDRMADRQRKLQGKRKPRLQKAKKRSKNNDYDDDDTDLWNDSDPEEDSTLCNVCLITGPTGSGKSHFVHAVAQQSDCPVLEINTTEARGSAALKNAIQEATQSCSSLDMLKEHNKQQATMKASIFCQVARTLEDSDDEEEHDKKEASTKRHTSVSVILIDEVDAIYEAAGDAGFWSALAAVAKTAKCPIFLTANSVPFMLRQSSAIRYMHIETVRPSPLECVPKILQTMRQHDGLQIRSEWGGVSTCDRLAMIAEVCHCDVRRIIHELQLFATTYANLDRGALPCKTDDESLESFPKQANLVVQAQPKITSIQPSSISARKFSVITIKGENFLSLMARRSSHSAASTEVNAEMQDKDLDIQIGDQACPKVRIVDDSTIFALCPPCRLPSSVDPFTCRFRENNRKNLSTQVATTSIRPAGKLGCVDVLEKTAQLIELFNGTQLASTTRAQVSYRFYEDPDSEHEFEAGKPLSETSRNEDDDVARFDECLTIWNASLLKVTECSSVASADYTAPRKCQDSDWEMLEVLEALSKEKHLTSDAAYLEELQGGIPSLSGACKGFGYTLTHESVSSGGELRLHDKARP